ncbi:hypothetical protein NDU88_007694 [Pleurodeles waltl]|uniref:Uncharacterized protein n=1 Tax=Pleurodeles waltl TaxID=8319 RepID=A0AAV7QLI6_PLEWA|nr:hypothetical protein NDU88_007694 [Pleurodeles waltl]
MGARPAPSLPADRALHRAHSTHTDALSDALQRILCQVGARPPFNVLLWQTPEPPVGSRHHVSPRPRRRQEAPRYRLQQGPPHSGIGLPHVPLDPWRPLVPTLQVDGPREWAVFKD